MDNSWIWPVFFNIIGDFTYKFSVFFPKIAVFGRISEFAYIGGMVCFTGGLLAIFYKLRKNIQKQHFLYGVIVAVGLFSFLWIMLINPAAISNTNNNGWINHIFFPASLFVISIISCIFLMTSVGENWSYRFLFLVLILNTIALYFYDIHNTSVQPVANPATWPSIISDATYSMAYLLIGIAFLHPDLRYIGKLRNTNVRTINNLDLFILAISFLLAPLAILIKRGLSLDTNTIIVFGSMFVIFLLVEWHLSRLVGILQHQNIHLYSQQEKLEHQALHDSLTGLPNRSYLSRHLEEQLQRISITRTQAAVFMIDLNNFKRVNDQFGHQKGDFVLKEISLKLSSFTRRSDLVGRWGGDEFIFILENITEPEALAFAKRLQKETFVQITMNGSELKVDISIGIKMIDENPTSSAKIIHLADVALYTAKNNFTDHIEIYKNPGGE